jgi:hypothetical protein
MRLCGWSKGWRLLLLELLKVQLAAAVGDAMHLKQDALCWLHVLHAAAPGGICFKSAACVCCCACGGWQLVQCSVQVITSPERLLLPVHVCQVVCI